MPDLYHALLQRDLGYLRIVAGMWGVELESQDADSAAEELAAAMLNRELAQEMMESLPAEAFAALQTLAASDGKIEWSAFARRFGEIREMGAGRRDRERPHLTPISPAEILFYRGFLLKAFFDSEKGAREFAYLPEDLRKLLPAESAQEKTAEPLGRPATPLEKAFEIPASDRILDDATTLLAALRMGTPPLPPDPALTALLTTAGILKKGVPQAEKVKTFLEAPRAAALDALVEAWKSSETFDELRLIPSLICEGEWKNQPQAARRFLLNLVNAIPKNKWWSVPAFVRAVKEKYPDFQRPAGDYDSWFIKRATDGQYLHGFAYWDQVDGALIKRFIQTLHWLGLADLAAPEAEREAAAFRVAPAKVEPSALNEKIAIGSDGKIVMSRFFSRAARYQISRFCEWEESKTDEYQYRVTARSLARAQEQGLQAGQLLALLVKHAKSAVPPALAKALKQWEARGAEAQIKNLLVLRVARPEILDELRKSKAGKFLGELLSPTAVVVKRGAEAKTLTALAEMGLFAEIEL
ncbi:MAG: helicase-associated domain-containing protein [Chloroflexi bacterium]|nr:helicase-associated domain-containing protein [Chloroflexota bacterium]